MHTLNDQVFRGFFTGRYLFDSVTGFLRYASPAAAGGFGPAHAGLLQRQLRHVPGRLPGRHHRHRRSAAASTCRARDARGLATDAAGASNITNDEFALFVQDTWQVDAALDPQLRPALGRAAHAGDGRSRARTAYAPFLNDPRFPSDGTIPGPEEAVPAAARLRLGRAGATGAR